MSSTATNSEAMSETTTLNDKPVDQSRRQAADEHDRQEDRAGGQRAGGDGAGDVGGTARGGVFDSLSTRPVDGKCSRRRRSRCPRASRRPARARRASSRSGSDRRSASGTTSPGTTRDRRGDDHRRVPTSAGTDEYEHRQSRCRSAPLPSTSSIASSTSAASSETTVTGSTTGQIALEARAVLSRTVSEKLRPCWRRPPCRSKGRRPRGRPRARGAVISASANSILGDVVDVDRVSGAGPRHLHVTHDRPVRCPLAIGNARARERGTPGSPSSSVPALMSTLASRRRAWSLGQRDVPWASIL